MIYTEVKILRKRGSLKEYVIKIINFKKKKMNSLTNEQQEQYEYVKLCYICKEKSKNKYLKGSKYSKVTDHCHYTGEYRGAVYRICYLKYSVSKNISVVFHD